MEKKIVTRDPTKTARLLDHGREEQGLAVGAARWSGAGGLRAHRDKAGVESVRYQYGRRRSLVASRSIGQPGDRATSRATFRLIFKSTVHG